MSNESANDLSYGAKSMLNVVWSIGLSGASLLNARDIGNLGEPWRWMLLAGLLSLTGLLFAFHAGMQFAWSRENKRA